MPHPANNEPNPGLERVYHELRSTGINDPDQEPLRSGIHSRGYLPHIKREGASYFVTFRLADALPQEVLLQFEQEKAARLRQLHQAKPPLSSANEEIHRDFQRKVERYLDKGHGACHLRNPRLADLVARTICHFEGQHYLLRDWVVMPNHVHVVLWPMPNYSLSEILKSWKQFTSRKAKRLLGIGEEAFWQRESFDRWIRNDAEKARICRYVHHNPVHAGLCAQPKDWRWSSAWSGSRSPS